MNSPPAIEALYQAYEDQLEALTRLFHNRDALIVDPKSRFRGMSSHELQDRLEWDRNELERWVVMMLVASFEGAVRTDAERRMEKKLRHDLVRKELQGLSEAQRGRMSVEEILGVWDRACSVKSVVKTAVRTLLKHRHWLAHGRHWTNKHGMLPEPPEVRHQLSEYVLAVRAVMPSFLTI